jgi:transcriptional regulator with XRE-family HTH domain
MTDRNPTAAAVRHHRHRAGLTQDELADRAGVSVRTVRGVETGRVRPRSASLRMLAEALAVPFHELRGEAPEPRRG